MSTNVAIDPGGVKPTSNEPTILKTKPILIIFNLPTRSASPPMTTIKIPENKEVIDTAMFIIAVSIRRSFTMSTLMFNVVCANSQNAKTPRIMPNRSLSLPLYGTVFIKQRVEKKLESMLVAYFFRDNFSTIQRYLLYLAFLNEQR